MKIVQSGFSIVTPIDTLVDGEAMLKRIEAAGRTCYKSEGRITPDSSRKFVAMVIERGHHSVIEHESVSVRFICDRGVSHEIVRHRLASYSQESTRYCNYSKSKFGKEITVIDPRPHMNPIQFGHWKATIAHIERAYFGLLEAGCKPQMARSVLPNSLKTELVMTANLREWRHFFTLRTSEAAHPQLVQITRPLLAEFRRLIPIVFDDVGTL